MRELSFTSLVRLSKCLVGLTRPRVRLQTQLNGNVLAWQITIAGFVLTFHYDRARLRIDITIALKRKASFREPGVDTVSVILQDIAAVIVVQ